MKNQFSADYASYEIFEPNRNRFWYNQLFNAEGYTASVTNVGHGTSPLYRPDRHACRSE